MAAAGHAIGSHTWCHQDLSKTKGRCNVNGKVETVEYDPKDEIEKGISAVRWAVGGPTAPYFRFPRCGNRRNLWTVSASETSASSQPTCDSFDFRCASPPSSLGSPRIRHARSKRGKGSARSAAIMRAGEEIVSASAGAPPFQLIEAPGASSRTRTRAKGYQVSRVGWR